MGEVRMAVPQTCKSSQIPVYAAFSLDSPKPVRLVCAVVSNARSILAPGVFPDRRVLVR